MASFGWGDIVEVAALCWNDVADTELAIAVHVFSMLSWVPMCAFRCCHSVTANAFELWASQPVPHVELSWVRVPKKWHNDCLRFLGQHCRNARQLAVWETPHFGERQLLRLVCGMRLLESLEVDTTSFGGSFTDPQRLLDRLAKYLPRLQHLVISFRHDCPSERVTLEVRALAWLGRRLLTLDLGAVAVRVAGGTRTLAACCPLLERVSIQLCQQQVQPLDAANPSDLAQGCARLQELDLAPVDWDDRVLEGFATKAPNLRSLILRHIAPGATSMLLAPLLALSMPEHGISGLAGLHLALHARSDPDRAIFWLEAISRLQGLRSLCLDYAAPLRLGEIVTALTLGSGAETAFGSKSDESGVCPVLASLTIHGCHGVDDASLESLVRGCRQLELVRIFPDSWREVGEVSDEGLRFLVQGLPRLRSLAVSSCLPVLFSDIQALPPEATPVSTFRLRSLSLFAPLSNETCRAVSDWRCLRHLWLGPHKLMQCGVASDCLIDDDGLQSVVEVCNQLMDLTVASRLITDTGVASTLLGCRELRRLRLGGRGITDESLKLLAGLSQPRMERFSLWFSGVTAEGLREAGVDVPWTYFDVELADPSESSCSHRFTGSPR
ncbi:unnamed protein product [Polarella glacialis]|uniref:Uncharacterized protein n=1 Tax=Polarella glacialis TaxID=89957 RepID=A0A813JTT2_POLGL|nr:unnamed protein product [Polarella glacialis]CAE8684088.1 unnamed protein product [Polarella glacialis]